MYRFFKQRTLEDWLWTIFCIASHSCRLSWLQLHSPTNWFSQFQTRNRGLDISYGYTYISAFDVLKTLVQWDRLHQLTTSQRCQLMLCLNREQASHFHRTLTQGYWSETVYRRASIYAYRLWVLHWPCPNPSISFNKCRIRVGWFTQLNTAVDRTSVATRAKNSVQCRNIRLSLLFLWWTLQTCVSYWRCFFGTIDWLSHSFIQHFRRALEWYNFYNVISENQPVQN